jgi:hypothetical protein
VVSGPSALALRFSRDFRDCRDGTHRLRFPNAPERITRKSREYLAPGTRTVTCHGAGAHAESGHQGRGNAVERRAALVAGFLRGIAKAQPLAAGRAVRVQALNRSARQGMHSSLRCGAATREKHRVNERDFAPEGLGSQEKYLLLVGVDIRGTCGWRYSWEGSENSAALTFAAAASMVASRGSVEERSPENPSVGLRVRRSSFQHLRSPAAYRRF